MHPEFHKLQMEHKKKAWIVTAILLFFLASWALYAVHDSAVAAARAARANKADTGAGCPFSKTPAASPSSQETKKAGSSCCHSKGNAVNSEASTGSSKDFSKYADMNDADLEEFKKQFTPEQLAKCPHLKARETKKKN